MNTTKQQLLVGTSKGLVVISEQANQWTIEKVHFLGFPVSFIHVDSRNHCWWVGLAHRHWGQKLHYSTDLGITWQVASMPTFPPETELRPGKPATVRKAWCLQSGGPDQAGVLWMGTEPGALFKSNDYGQSWALVEGLWNHPSRTDQNQWFGAGRDEPFIHSIVVDPRDANHLYIAVSCAGVFESKDGGTNWVPRNNGLIAAYLPNPKAEVGHDPHLVLACYAQPDVLWQQNHCGIFRSPDGGQQWELLSNPDSVPHYGFALAIDHADAKRAWVIPAISDEMRVAADLQLKVYHTNDGGENWTAQDRGLPQKFCFDIVFRHSFVRHHHSPILAFGTTTGKLYLSDNDGGEWHCATANLARIDCLAFSV